MPTLRSPNGIAKGSGTTTVSGATTLLVMTKPTGAAAADGLWAMACFKGGTGVGTITPPAGWTLVRRIDNSTNYGLAVWAKLAGGGEPANYTFTFPSATTRKFGYIMAAYTGAVAALSDPGHSGRNNGFGTNALTTAISPITGYSQVLFVAGLNRGFASTPYLSAAPATFTKQDEVTSGTTTGSDISLAFADVATTATINGAGTWTSGANNSTILIGMPGTGNQALVANIAATQANSAGGTITAALTVDRPLAATISASATITAMLAGTAHELAATIAATQANSAGATITAALNVPKALAATISATQANSAGATITATLTVPFGAQGHALAASIVGTSSLTADLDVALQSPVVGVATTRAGGRPIDPRGGGRTPYERPGGRRP